MGEDTSADAGRTVAAETTAAAGLILGLDGCHLLITGWLLHCHHLVQLGLVGQQQPVRKRRQGADVAAVLFT